jgi:hypothetical protein
MDTHQHQLHPDGIILGIDTPEAIVKIWNVKCQVKKQKYHSDLHPCHALLMPLLLN